MIKIVKKIKKVLKVGVLGFLGLAGLSTAALAVENGKYYCISTHYLNLDNGSKMEIPKEKQIIIHIKVGEGKVVDLHDKSTVFTFDQAYKNILLYEDKRNGHLLTLPFRKVKNNEFISVLSVSDNQSKIMMECVNENALAEDKK